MPFSFENDLVAALITSRQLVLGQQRKLGADASKQMRSHRAALDRIAEDNGDWRRVSWNKYTTFCAANNAPPFPITPSLFGLWFYELAYTSENSMANYVSHIEQLRVATENIWTATPETKLGKVPLVKALVHGFRGTGSTVSSSDESDDERGGSSRDSSVDLRSGKRRRGQPQLAPVRIFLARKGDDWPVDLVDPSSNQPQRPKVRIAGPPPAPPIFPWFEPVLPPLVDEESKDDDFAPAKLPSRRDSATRYESPELDAPAKAEHTSVVSTSALPESSKILALRQEVSYHQDMLANVRGLLAMLAGITLPTTPTPSYTSESELESELARLRDSHSAAKSLLARGKASKRALITVQRRELERLRSEIAVNLEQSELAKKKLKGVAAIKEVADLVAASAKLAAKLVTARRHLARSREPKKVKDEVKDEACDAMEGEETAAGLVDEEPDGILAAKVWTAAEGKKRRRSKGKERERDIDTIVLDDD